MTELMRAKDILKPTLMMGSQASSGFFSLRSTCMWMEGLLYAIRGSSSFAKCLGVAKKKKKVNLSGKNSEYWYSERKAKPPKSRKSHRKRKRRPNLAVVGRMQRGAAGRAASKLKSDMEDRNQFEKEIKHGQVIGSWEGKRSLYSANVTQSS